KQVLDVPLSIVVSSKRAIWEELSSRIEKLKMQLNFQIGNGQEMIIIENTSRFSKTKSSRYFLELQNLRSKIKKLDLLETYMDKGMNEEYTTLFDELFTMKEPLFNIENWRWFGLEIFSHLSAFFLSYVNTRELLETNDINIEVDK